MEGGEKRMESKKFITTLVFTLAVLSLLPVSIRVLSDIAYYPDHDPPYYVWTPWLYSWARQYGSNCYVGGYLDGWTYDKQTIVYGSAGVSAGYPSSPYWTPDDPLRDYVFCSSIQTPDGKSGYYLYIYENIYLQGNSQPIHEVYIKIWLSPSGNYWVQRSDSPN